VYLQSWRKWFLVVSHPPIYVEKPNNNVFTDFYETVIWVGVGVIKSDQKIKIWLKSDKNNRRFT